MSEPMEEKSKRRWLKISVRTLLLVVAMQSVGCHRGAPQQSFDSQAWKDGRLRNEMIDDVRSSVARPGTSMAAVRKSLGEPDDIVTSEQMVVKNPAASVHWFYTLELLPDNWDGAYFVVTFDEDNLVIKTERASH